MEKRTLHFPEIGWTIQVPAIFRLLRTKEVNGTKEVNIRAHREAKTMARKAKKDLGVPGARTIFYALNDRYNIMTATLAPVTDRSEYEKHTTSIERRETLLKNFKTSMPHAGLDNRIEKVWLDGIEFDDFQVIIRAGEKILFWNHIFSAEIGDHTLDISLFYRNDQVGGSMLQSLKDSKFAPPAVPSADPAAPPHP